jgi:hypothetical protein
MNNQKEIIYHQEQSAWHSRQARVLLGIEEPSQEQDEINERWNAMVSGAAEEPAQGGVAVGILIGAAVLVLIGWWTRR